MNRTAYNRDMARGWESKSVEAQQAEAGEQAREPRAKLTAKEATIVREREGLFLARKRILQQIELSSNPRHHKVLEDALADLDRKLKQLGESSKDTDFGKNGDASKP
jgi:hypothetical protein